MHETSFFVRQKYVITRLFRRTLPQQGGQAKRVLRSWLILQARVRRRRIALPVTDALHLTMDQVIADRSAPAASQQRGFLIGTGLGRRVTELLL